MTNKTKEVTFPADEFPAVAEVVDKANKYVAENFVPNASDPDELGDRAIDYAFGFDLFEEMSDEEITEEEFEQTYGLLLRVFGELFGVIVSAARTVRDGSPLGRGQQLVLWAMEQTLPKDEGEAATWGPGRAEFMLENFVWTILVNMPDGPSYVALDFAVNFSDDDLGDNVDYELRLLTDPVFAAEEQAARERRVRERRERLDQIRRDRGKI